jgi:hypothetical protein
MPYDTLATSRTPALIIYLLDVSNSMSKPLGSKRRIDVVVEALGAALRQMVFRSTKGVRVAPRYRVALLTYSDQVRDLLSGIETIDQVVGREVPQLEPLHTTDTARAFEYVERLLKQELQALGPCPAPLVCHMTDGKYTGEDPEPIVRRIMDMEVPDGKVLVENIFISDQILTQPIVDPKQWSGILPTTKLASDYARKLRAISSQLPHSYRLMMQEAGYEVTPNACMMLPGTSPELVEMGFVMAISTPVAH